MPARRPVRIADLVDDVERILDEHVIDRPHVAGNSLGGWMALELARRGRARTVCALSPAGTWAAGTPEQTDGVRKIRQTARRRRGSGDRCRSSCGRRGSGDWHSGTWPCGATG